jgi:hypothetical protein
VRGLFVTSACCVFAVSTGLPGQAPAAGSNWQRVEQLPLHTHVHVSSDKMGRVCAVDSVDEESLSCSAGRLVNTAHYTFPRTEIKSIKVTRYVLSTVGGAGIGAGVGAIIGGAATSGKNSTIGISNGQVVGITAGIGGIVGAVICGPADLLRGPTIYRRPKP